MIHIIVVKKLDNPNNNDINVIIEKLQASINPQLVKLVIYDETVANIVWAVFPDVKLVISLGGDGTAIFAAKIATRHEVPVICFNMGNLGFLADHHPSTICNVIKNFLLSQVTMIGYENSSTRTVLVNNKADNYVDFALNEYVLSGEYSDEIIELDMYIDDELAGTHKCNGIVISTATGSTAYSLSLGGPIMHPSCDTMLVSFVAPVTLTSRPMMVSTHSSIRFSLSAKNKNAVMVKCDGQRQFVMKQDVTIRASRKVTFIHPQDWTFYKTLSSKLNWNTK
jgi:NAD+ kinase